MAPHGEVGQRLLWKEIGLQEQFSLKFCFWLLTYLILGIFTRPPNFEPCSWLKYFKIFGIFELNFCCVFLKASAMNRVWNQSLSPYLHLIWHYYLNCCIISIWVHCRIHRHRNITLPFCSTLALIAIPLPTASGLQTGRANRRV